MSVSITPGAGAAIETEQVGGSGSHQQVTLLGYRFTTPLSEVSINAATNGDNTIVAAVVSQSVRLYRFFLMATGGAVNVKWKNGAGTDFHPALTLLGNGSGWQLDFDTLPWFTTTAGNALILNLSGAVQVSGRAYYVQA
jgi:hypothetical protein